MSEIEVTVDMLPDNDSFLPRYLIVQLLDILAHTPEANNPEIDINPTERAQQFIETFKSPLLFTPLTFSIFWRDNIEQVLAQNPDLLNQTDQYNRAPLTIAIANEDFILADKLVKQGARVMLEDKLVLEIALTSMIQSNDNIIKIILANADNAKWLSEYLLYLQGYVNGSINESKVDSKYHEVLNPPLRYFGQVLDTISYFNGLPSHFGFLSPSIENLTKHLQIYSQELLDETAAALFNKIAKAYAFSADTCKYHGNLTTTPDCEMILAAQITKNINNNYNPVVVFGGWAGNSVTIAFVNKYLIFSNLGVGGNPESGTKIYAINNPDAITPDLIASFMNGLGLAASPNTILAKFSDIVAIEHIYTIAQDLNPIDNCIFVNPRAIIQGILLVLNTYNTNKNITFDTLDSQSKHISTMYTSYVNSLHEHFIKNLTSFMRDHELLKNKRIECCSLALDYINQHYNDPDALARCIELKNALEFVGLKKFYVNNISEEAKDAILDATIQQQEAKALQVIEQEYAIVAAQNGST